MQGALQGGPPLAPSGPSAVAAGPPSAAGSLALGVVFVLAAAALLSFKGVLVKWAYAEGAGTIPLLYARFAMALPLFWALALARKGIGGIRELTRRDAALAVGGAGLAMYIAWAADFTALKLIDVGLERVILFSFPVFVLLFDSLRLKRVPPRRHVLALILVELGIVMALGGHDLAYIRANLEGGAYALLSAFMFAVFIMINQKSTARIGPVRFSTLATTGAFLALSVHFFALESPESLIFTMRGYVLTALLAVFATVVPYLLFAEGLRRTGASRAAVISGIGPPAALAYGFFLLGETMTPVQLIGVALVVVGVIALEARLPKLPSRTAEP